MQRIHSQAIPGNGSALVTAGDLLFWGDLERRFNAFDSDTGEILWRTVVGGIVQTSTITYAVDGVQYLAIVVGQTGYHVNDWARMYDIFAEPEGMPVNDAPKGGAAIWVYALSQ